MFRFSDMFSLNQLYASIVRSRSKMEKLKQAFQAENFRWYVKVFENPNEMRATLGFSMPSWVKAFSFRNYVCFLEQGYWIEPEQNGYDDLLVHECTHCLVKDRYGISVPKWFDEGTAMYFAGQIGSTDGIGLPPAERDIGCIGYDEHMLYSYSSLFMNALLSTCTIDDILKLADDAESFAQYGPLGDKALRESITAYKEK